MSGGLLAVDGVRPTVISRANPVAKLAVVTVVSLALLLTVDPVTAAVAVAAELAALPFCGVPAAVLGRRGLLVATGVLPAAVLTAVIGPDGGAVLVAAGSLSVTSGSATDALAIGLRVVAIALPGVVLLASTDPTDLGDALAQVLHLPARFVLAALAALRLFDVLVAEWQQLGLARRARGLGGDHLPGRLADVAGRAFALLVLALRRAAVLATAMEARGFGVGTGRTWARPSALRRSDAVVIAGGVAVAVASTTAGLIAGTWHLVLG